MSGRSLLSGLESCTRIRDGLRWGGLFIPDDVGSVNT